MMRKLSIPVLALLLLMPAVCALDTSPYTDIASEIAAKEVEMEAARAREDWETALTIKGEIEALENQLGTNQMRYLGLYEDLQLSITESEQLIGQAELDLDVASLKSELNQLLQTLSRSESSYNTQDYSSALSMIESIKSQLVLYPATLASGFVDAADALRSDLELKSQVTPSTVSMLEDSKKRFKEAEQSYNRAADSVLAGDVDEAASLMDKARLSVSNGFELVRRAIEQGGTLLDGVKIALIVLPLVLIIGLLAYFYMQFKRSVIISSVSALTAPGDTESFIERNIVVINLEKSPVLMRVSDSPPKALGVHDLGLAPKQRSGNEMVWEFEMPPGKGREISYKLHVPKLAAGWKLRVQAATASYMADGRQKKFVGKPSEIQII